MTTRGRTTLNGLLGSGTFVLVLAVAAGCAHRTHALAHRNTDGNASTLASEMAPPPVRIAQLDTDDVDDDADGVVTSAANQPARPAMSHGADVFEPPTAPSINVFGEFDGHDRGPVRAVAEAGFQQHTYVDEGYDADVAVDPTGKWLVFASTRHAESSDLYLQKVDGASVTQLTADDSDDATPSFSPDGKRIAFASTRAGTWDLYVMDADGRNVTQVTSGPMQDLHPSFSPDATRLVYSSVGSRSGQWELWVVDLRTMERKMIGFGLFPCWSPNKSVDRIAYQRARQRGSRWFSIWTLDLSDGEARRNTEVAVSSNAALVCPTWSPDGRRLAFSTIIEPRRSAGSKSVGQQDVWTVNADGSNRQRLTDGNGQYLTPFWAPDNRVYFVSDRNGAETVWSVRAQRDATRVAEDDDRSRGKDAVGSTDVSDFGR
jgi:Tol biopolymer transport system component